MRLPGVVKDVIVAIRSVLWTARSSIGRGAIIKIPGTRSRLKLWPRHSLSRSIYRKRDFEPDVGQVLRRYLRPGMCYVDVGANIGYFVVVGADRVGETGQVYAFEPSPIEYARLKENASINGFAHVNALNVAVSKECGDVILTDYGESFGAYNTIGESTHPDAPAEAARELRVPSLTLDSYFKDKRCRQPDVIKIDAEGAEYLILQGAVNLLKAEPGPIVICEVADVTNIGFGHSAKDIGSFLGELGYHRYCIDRSDGTLSVPSDQEFSQLFNFVFSKQDLRVLLASAE